MRCIFCKFNSDDSRSVEHIFPESLGNKEHVLPRGCVCDGCNNYFASKVEKPFLDSPYGRNSRFIMHVPNKDDRIPHGMGLHPSSRSKIDLSYSCNEGISISAAPGEDEARLISTLQSSNEGRLYIPIPHLPETGIVTSRFIGKVALEALAFRLLSESGWNDEVVDNTTLDELRRYVRRGSQGFVWPVYMWRIYDADAVFDDGAKPYQVLHEFDILCTQHKEYYVVMAIFGVEYAINLGGPELGCVNVK